MSNYYYNPIPPRVWSRVQNTCASFDLSSNYTSAYIPLTGQTVSQAEADYIIKQFYKGNILQYKGNSARLTKSQKYTQLATCTGPNRTKVFATQSQIYTNPNTTGLLRVGYVTYPFPNQIFGAPNNISGRFTYNVRNPNDCSSNSVQDGGILVCGTYANPCSGEVFKTGVTTATVCNPASASNVPGPGFLCWRNDIQTWFPKPRYANNNSTDKWPINYKGFVSAIKLYPPILSAIVSNCIINLSWYQKRPCYPIRNYDIYVNNNLYVRVPFNVNNYSFSGLEGNYIIYIKSVSDKLESRPSNIIDATIAGQLVIVNYNNLKRTVYTESGYKTVVIESTIQPKFGEIAVSNGVFYYTGCSSIQPVNILLVGAGGGGASGYNGTSGGGGGGSGAVSYITNFTLPINTEITINVGIGGGGRTPGNKGGGNSSGIGGSNSSIYYSSTQIISNGGSAGLGVGTASGYGGGPGGNATITNAPAGPTISSGYGGSSAGGAYKNGGGPVTLSGSVGTGYTSNGLQGSSGSGSYNNQVGGNGANSVFPSLSIPSLGTVYFGGSGGGGGYYGGYAGANGVGGLGGLSNVGQTGGTNATTYGAGGGGGGAVSTISNTGGNGANGVIIIWWQI